MTLTKLFGNDATYFNGYVSDEARPRCPLLCRRHHARRHARRGRPVHRHDEQNDRHDGWACGVHLPAVYVYLLTKAVIDHSARSISYMKVFGYRDSEISHLYIRSITLCVAASLVLSLPVIIGSLTAIFRSMLLAYNGNIEIYVPAWSIVACVGIGFATYLSWRCCTRAAHQARRLAEAPQGEYVKNVLNDKVSR